MAGGGTRRGDVSGKQFVPSLLDCALIPWEGIKFSIPCIIHHLLSHVRRAASPALRTPDA